ncbi:MAG: T9SS type B sorting domain-containing protein, partial [Flavobacteriales bacterium]|nr:T9SS type B sorting domain-containing protein [Flavobacteriales bacterium]
NTDPDADPCQAESLPNPGGQGHTVILEKLLEESEIVSNYYTNRYIDLGNTVFTCDHTIAFLDSLVGLMAPEMPGHVARWGGSVAGWEANVQEIRDFMLERCEAIQDGLIDCYDLDGPYEVTFNVDPPEAGTIRINSITPEAYPFSGTYYGGIDTELEARGNNLPGEEPEWIFSHWEIFGPTTINPTMNDSLVVARFFGADSIVAHFVPPIRYDILLDADPPGSAAILFNDTLYADLPRWVTAPEETPIHVKVVPALYFDFDYWTVENNLFLPDSTSDTLSISFWEGDTIIAHLTPQDHVFFLPNAFTPNGDGINDVFMPVANVVDLELYVLRIYDRWGRLLFETTDPWEGWDGTAGGTDMPDGVYVFQADVVDAIKRDRFEFAGHFTLFR